MFVRIFGIVYVCVSGGSGGGGAGGSTLSFHNKLLAFAKNRSTGIMFENIL